MIGGNRFFYKGEMSPGVDAGDPQSDYSKEPVISGIGGNGRRVNLRSSRDRHRSRTGKCNDNAHVEEKNGSIVRELFGELHPPPILTGERRMTRGQSPETVTGLGRCSVSG